MNYRIWIITTSFVLFASNAMAQGRSSEPSSQDSGDDLEVSSAPASQDRSTPQEPANPNAPAQATIESARGKSAAGSERAEPAQSHAIDTHANETAPGAARVAAPTASGSMPVQSASAASDVNRVPLPGNQSMAVSLQVGGYLQFDYQYSQASEDQLQQGNGPMNQNRFLLRRARLRVDRYWQWALATLELDANTLSGPTVGIRRAEGTLFFRGSNAKDKEPLVAFMAGILDLPFGRELPESDRTQVFMERTLASSALFPTKMDAGIKVFGAVSFLRYGLSISNGEPLDNRGFPRDPNSAKDVTGRLGVVAELPNSLQVTGGISVAKGRGFHAGSLASKSQVTWRDDNQDGIATSDELVGVPGSAAQPSGNFDRWALGLDLGFRVPTPLGTTHVFSEAYAASNYDRGFLPSDPISTGVDVRQLGGYAAVTQEITEYALVGMRVALYDPNADLFEERQGRVQPKSQTVRTISLVAGLTFARRLRLSTEYDFIHDYLGRDNVGVPTDARNNTWTTRLQVDL